MSKLNIDGKLVDVAPVLTITKEVSWTAARLHAIGECHSLPTYFCPHCAREALRGVDVSDPSGWRGP